ncbi:MAG: hypothetical protein GY710_06230 [Desulfobacteraceae bacterium]|nr:hypothetical protein [Desulfobacteraceae bacterium]
MKKEYNYSLPVKYTGGQQRHKFKCWNKKTHWELARAYFRDRIYSRFGLQVNLKIILNKKEENYTS